MAKVKRSFFLRSDVVLIARELLGKCIFTRLHRNTDAGAHVTGGIIVEACEL